LILPGIVLAIGIGGLDIRIPIVVALIRLGATAVTLVLGSFNEPIEAVATPVIDMSEVADLIAICAYYFLVVGVVLNFASLVRKRE